MSKVTKLKYFGHITRGNTGELASGVQEGSIEGNPYQRKPRRHG